jgi:hypothetical protein
MKKSLLLALLVLVFGAAFGLSTARASAADLPTDSFLECHAGGPALMRFLKECAHCDDPSVQTTKIEFMACVEQKLADTDLTPEKQAAVYAAIDAKVQVDAEGYVICPERQVKPLPRVRRAIMDAHGILKGCAACDGDVPVSLAAFVECVRAKVAELGLADDVAAKIIEAAENHPVDAEGNVVCPNDRPHPPRRPGRGPGRG